MIITPVLIFFCCFPFKVDPSISRLQRLIIIKYIFNECRDFFQTRVGIQRSENFLRSKSTAWDSAPFPIITFDINDFTQAFASPLRLSHAIKQNYTKRTFDFSFWFVWFIQDIRSISKQKQKSFFINHYFFIAHHKIVTSWRYLWRFILFRRRGKSNWMKNKLRREFIKAIIIENEITNVYSSNKSFNNNVWNSHQW